MKDWIDIVKQFGLPITPWVLLGILLLYIFRDRLNKGLNALLDWLGTIFRGTWSQRRFERTFRPAIRGKHLYMRVVGIHAEKGREPTIPEAYVPLHLAPYLDESLGNQPNRRVAPANPSIVQSLLPDELLPVENILQRYTQLVVLGDPGAGKSTLLKHLVISFTEPQVQQRVHTISPRRFLAFKRFQRSRSIVPCPFYISLRSCLARNSTLLEDILDPETKILEGMLPSNQRKKMPKRFIERCVEEGRAILLLDGLDEVTNEDMYEDVVRKINDFRLSYPDNCIVVTCRIAGWHRGLPDFALYRAMPLDRQQQHTFISCWYQTAYKQNISSDALLEEEKSIGNETEKLSASEESDALERLFKERDRLAELAANPMLLSLICLVYHLQRDLPRGRAALYDECVQILLGVWDRVDKGLKIVKPSMDEKRKILRHVAYELHSTGQKDISRQDFVRLVMNDLNVSQDEAYKVVRQIEVRSWMIVERVIDRLAFSHLTLQEFFVVEYLQIEQQNRIDFATITDWNIWREPILLMCGKSADPTTFIERLVAYNPELALLCIPEADNTRLNLQHIHLLLDSTLEKVGKGQLALIDMIPALVGLMSIDKSPFSKQIMDFVKAYFHTFDAQGRADLVTTIANCGTREAARLLLYLRDSVPDQRPNILNGLVLIGGVAVEEALLSCRRNELSEAALKVLLLRSYAPEATQALWERYGLIEETETKETRIEWSESWACRLALPENDRLMHAIPYNGSIDPEIWPYRKSQRTALAAIVQRCVQILRGVYGGKEYIYEKELFVHDIEQIARFDLRVQIPLLVRLKFPDKFSESLDHGTRIDAALGFEHSIHFWVGYLKESAWHGLMAAKGKKSDQKVRLRVGSWIGFIGQLGSCVLGWMGVIVLFWNILPYWLTITIAALLSLSGIVSIIIVLIVFLLLKQLSDRILDKYENFLILFLLVFSTGYTFIWAYDAEEVYRLLATGKMRLWYPLVLLATAIGYGVLGGFVLSIWIHISLLLCMFMVILAGLICSILQAWTSPFTRESMFLWLEKHPHGHVVLDEFQE